MALEPIRHILSKQRIILASGSPRRYELLKMIGLDFEVHSSTFDEKSLDKSKFSHPSEYVKENAKQKAIEVWNRLSKESKIDLIISADTVVTLDEDIIEKPKNETDAFDILRRLSGHKHTVFTGVALLTKIRRVQRIQSIGSNSQPSSLELNNDSDQFGAQSLQYNPYGTDQQRDYVVTTFHESTDVTMAELSDDVIKGYIATGEPLDKAGAYGIQCNGATLIEQIRGDFYNVVGLPIRSLARELFILLSEL